MTKRISNHLPETEDWILMIDDFVYYTVEGMSIIDWLNDNLKGRWTIIDRHKDGWPYWQLKIELEEDVVLFKLTWL